MPPLSSVYRALMDVNFIVLACRQSRQLYVDLLSLARAGKAKMTSSTFTDTVGALQPQGPVQGVFPLQLPLRIDKLHADKKSS